jgi:hypothetical protein
MAKQPDWNDAHRTNPGAVRDALTEPDIPFDDPPPRPNGQPNGEAKTKHFELIPFGKIAIDTTPAYLVKGIIPRTGLCVLAAQMREIISRFRSAYARRPRLEIPRSQGSAGRRSLLRP